MITVPLKKPITAHAEELRSITLREPTAEDVMAEGFPTLMVPSTDGKSVAVDIRANVVGRYISRLGGIPMSSVKTLSLPDLQACMNEVMSFFGNGEDETSGSSPTASSTSPTSGD